VRFERDGSQVIIHADSDTMLLVLDWREPLGEPVYGYGPFVMTNEKEIRQAIDDFQRRPFRSGRARSPSLIVGLIVMRYGAASPIRLCGPNSPG